MKTRSGTVIDPVQSRLKLAAELEAEAFTHRKGSKARGEKLARAGQLLDNALSAERLAA